MRGFWARAVLLGAVLSSAGACSTETPPPEVCAWFERCGATCPSCDDGDPCTLDACIRGQCTVLETSDACRCTPTCPPVEGLRHIQTLRHGDGGLTGLETIRALASSEDAAHLYVAASGLSLVRDGGVAAHWEPKALGLEDTPTCLAITGDLLVAGASQRTQVLQRDPEGLLTPRGSLGHRAAGLAAAGTRVVALDGRRAFVVDVSQPDAPALVAAREGPDLADARAVVVVGRRAVVAGFQANAVVALDLDTPDLALVGRVEGAPGLTRPDALAVLDDQHVAVAGFCDNAIAVVGVGPDGLTWLTAWEPSGLFLETGPASECPTAEAPDAFIHPGALAANGEHLLVMTGARRYFAAEWLRWDGVSLVPEGPVVEQPPTFDGSGMDYITDPTPAPVPFDPMKLRGLVSATAAGTHVAAASAISNALAPLTPEDTGDFLQRGQGGAGGLTCVAGLALSPDGTELFTASRCVPEVGHLQVDGARGTLAPLPTVPLPNAGPYDLVAAVAAPNANTLVVVSASPTAEAGGAVTVFARQGAEPFAMEAALTLPGCDGKRAFPVGLLTLGADLYVADFQREGSSCVHHVRRGPAGLELEAGVTSPDIAGIESFDATADGRHVYAACYVAEGVTAYTREPETGALTLLSRFVRSDTRGAEFVALSPDERQLYVTSPVESTLVVYDRDSAGILTWLQTLDANAAPMRDAAGLTVLPGGEQVLVSARASDALLAFDRGLDGRLELSQAVEGLFDWPNAVVAAPDGRHVYVAAVKSSGVTVLRRGGDGCGGECP